MPLGSYVQAPGLRLNDCWFSEPAPLDGWNAPKCAGLFGIFVPDPNWAPRPFQPVYFGEFGNNAQTQVLLEEFRNLLAAPAGRTLLVSVLPMPFSTSRQRGALRSELIWAYNPLCQAGDGRMPSLDLARKLDELEKRHQEQTAQVMLLLANVNGVTGLQSETPPRRTIGFLPQLEPAG